MHHQNPPKAPVKLPPAVLKALADTLEAGRRDASLQTLVMIAHFFRKNPSSMSLHGQSLRQLLVSVLLPSKKWNR